MNNKKNDDLNENKNNLKNFLKDIILEGNSHDDGYTCVIARLLIYIACLGLLFIFFYHILFDNDSKNNKYNLK
jgi:hypothetical protein